MKNLALLCSGLFQRGYNSEIPAHARDEVHHVHLMIEHHHCNDIAVVIAGQQLRLTGICKCSIAEMLHRTGTSADVPAAPSVFQRRSMVQQVRAERIHRSATGCRINAANQHSRNVQTVTRQMTCETLVAPDDEWLITRLLEQH